jgi:hypothetical protein
MSIPKLQLVPQPCPQAEIITDAPATLDSAKTIIVNREQLSEAHEDARHISSALYNAENLSDLDISELADLCRTIYHAIEVLSAMLNATPEVAT